jgi:hypothetical protein
VDDRIRVQVEGLMQFPESGPPGRIEETRELVILRTPCIAAYRITGDTVRILRVLRGAQHPGSWEPGSHGGGPHPAKPGVSWVVEIGDEYAPEFDELDKDVRK